MLTAERIQEYKDRGYSIDKLIRKNRNKAKNWQIKLAMSEIDPKRYDTDYDKKLINLPRDVWKKANEIKDTAEIEKFINQANVGVELFKAQGKIYRLKGWLIVAGIVWYHTVFVISMLYFGVN